MKVGVQTFFNLFLSDSAQFGLEVFFKERGDNNVDVENWSENINPELKTAWGE